MTFIVTLFLMKMHSILTLALLFQSAHATSFFIEPFSQFTKSTALIIRGVTTNIHAEYSSNQLGEKTIFTYADLSIKDVIKGNVSGSNIKIRRLGGTLDGVTLEVPSSVELNENEDGVFFLSEERDDHTYEVTGMELGKFLLEKSKGQEILKGGLFHYSPHTHLDEGTQAFQAGDLSENLKPWSLDQLKDLVRSQAGSTEQAPPTIKNNLTNSNTSKTTVLTQSTPMEPQLEPVKQQELATPSAPQPHLDSPLYFNSALWYALAILFLTLGVYTVLRRR